MYPPNGPRPPAGPAWGAAPSAQPFGGAYGGTGPWRPPGPGMAGPPGMAARPPGNMPAAPGQLAQPGPQCQSHGPQGDGAGDPSGQEQEESKLPGDTKYKNITCNKGNFGQQLLDDLRLFGRHFQRSKDNAALLSQGSSPHERQYMHDIDPDALNTPIVVNMLVWRRSSLKVAFFWVCLFLFFHMFKVVKAVRKAMTPRHASEPGLESFEAYQDEFGDQAQFKDYATAVMKEIARALKVQMAFVQALKGIIVAGAVVMALVFITRALKHWAHHVRSFRHAIPAWLLFAGAPYIASFIPVRGLIDWGPSQHLVEVLVRELENNFHVSDQIEKMEANCKKMELDPNAQEAKVMKSVKNTCRIVNAMPSGDFKFPGSWKIWQKWNTLNLDDGRMGCDKAQGLIDKGRLKEAVKAAQKACATARPVFEQYHSKPGMAQYLVLRARVLPETFISFALGGQEIIPLLIAGITVAPGFSNGAFIMKTMVPQAIIPGIMIILLPLTFVPLLFCIVSLIFQGLGDPFLVIGLSLLALAPATNTIMAKVMQVDKPLTDEQVQRAFKRMGMCVKLMLVHAIVFIAAYLLPRLYQFAKGHRLVGRLDDDQGEEVNWWIEEENRILMKVFGYQSLWKIFEALRVVLLTIACLIQARNTLSCIAAVDIMVTNQINSYHYLQLMRDELESKEKQGKNYMPTPLTDIAVEWDARMQGLLALFPRKKAPAKSEASVHEAEGVEMVPRGSSASLEHSNRDSQSSGTPLL